MNDEIEKLVRGSLAARRHDSFADGFADRTIARWRTGRSMGEIMVQPFKQLIPFAVAAALVLGFYNARSASAGPALDRLLGLTTVTVDAAYGLGSN